MTTLRFTTESRITPAESVEVPEAYREALGDVVSIEEGEDGTVDRCELDVERLLDVLVLHEAMERLDFGWRRPARTRRE